MRRILLISSLVIILALAGLAGFGVWLLQPVSKQSVADQTFVVPKGQAIAIIGKRLTDEHLIRHPLIFRAVVWKLQLAKKLQAGTFTLNAAQTPMQIAKKLTEGTNDQWITVKEGLRREEIADIFSSQLESFDREEFLAATEGLEGQLFPDTYLVPKHLTARAAAELLLNTFQQKIIEPNQQLLAAQQRTELEVLTLASLIEREARGASQQQIVSNILNHRLAIGMPLQVDATLQYVRGFDGKTWWPTPLSADRERVSPYNTYSNPGLPPAPICNPGAQAFSAALQPRPTDDLFYLHDDSGQIHPAQTLSEHNANIAKYLQ